MNLHVAYQLSSDSLKHAVKHLCRYGDTDVFPHLPELAFLREQESAILNELEALDLDSFDPVGAIEALGPKSRFGFRIAHQLPLVDTILLLAAVIEIGPQIEDHRQPSEENSAFAYRFKPDGNGSIFRDARTFKDWLKFQIGFIQGNLKIRQIVTTDISDFYARINFHRLENLLGDAASSENGAVRYIKKHIKFIRAKQSFGLPVGGSAARLLAELVLVDTDSALKNDGRLFTRFVDDFRIFLRADEDPYDALALLAEQLGIGEGLSLNVAKTRVETRSEYLDRLKHLISDVSEEAEGAALDALTSGLYFDDEPDLDELQALKQMNLLGFLQEEVGKDAYDMGRIKVIFRALKLAKPPEAIAYLSDNFEELVVFAKEVTLLMQELEKENPDCFSSLTVPVIKSITRPPSSSVQLIRTWLLELFVRGIVPLNATDLKEFSQLSSPLDRRQLHLIRGRIGNKTDFRKAKTAFGQLSATEQISFVWGASCLPKDEFNT